MTTHERAGTPATPADLVDLEALERAYYDQVPDPHIAAHRVTFGTSGHRGSAFATSFNETHIVAICRAVAEHRSKAGVTGPLFLGADTHPLSAPAERTARETLAHFAPEIDLRVSLDDEFVPTPALSRAILAHDNADGIIITPSHNPPADGGIKYNEPHGGPASTDTTAWIENRANELLADSAQFLAERRENDASATCDDSAAAATPYDFLGEYVAGLERVIDIAAIRQSPLALAAHPMGGASVAYWERIATDLLPNLTVLGAGVDPQWGFMTLDWDGKIRMDPSSAHAMAGVLTHRNDFDIVTGNDADADRHGIITRGGGLMNPNHFLAVAIDYLLTHRPEWSRAAKVGKTIVSSAMIDRVVAAHGRQLHEVPVGFKWFVDGLCRGGAAADGLVFGGEESAGASFVCFDGSPWSTDKDGILLALLAAEIQAVTGKSPSQRYRELCQEHGEPFYARTDMAATTAQKARLKNLAAADVTAETLAGDPITEVATHAPSGDAIGGLVIRTEHAWCAIRPSGTEAVMKVYAESFRGPEHLAQLQHDAAAIVASVLD